MSWPAATMLHFPLLHYRRSRIRNRACNVSRNLHNPVQIAVLFFSGCSQTQVQFLERLGVQIDDDLRWGGRFAVDVQGESALG